ncbi:MAG: LysR family transcriptional regulator [Gemmobacter sp.]|nr:LysR family transcriptional regulator [Gemmobacter sp.]
MDWRGFPPLSALRAFLAFAEAETLDQAGARIGVTHAAISQQIRSLEAHLGLALVERGGRRLALTADGRRLADSLAVGFGQIGQTLASLTGADETAALRITTTPSFAAGWLMPRLADFRARHPAVDLVIDPAPENREIGAEADVALRYGNGHWPGLEARLILRSSVVVVAAPSLVPPGAAPDAPLDLDHLAGLPWLQELGTHEASQFFDTYGMRRRVGAALITLPGNLMLDAARNGQGVAVIAEAFVAADLAAGRLRLLFEDAGREGYFLVTRPGPQRASLRAFCQWVMRQAAQPGESV